MPLRSAHAASVLQTVRHMALSLPRCEARWLNTSQSEGCPLGTMWVSIRWRVICAVLFLPLALFGYAGAVQSSNDASSDGATARGEKLIKQFSCGTCHVIPGIEGAKGLVGPSLSQVSKRIYIAGVLRNTPDNMIRWLRHPQAIVPNNAMPDMDLSEQQARDIASYLHTLE